MFIKNIQLNFENNKHTIQLNRTNELSDAVFWFLAHAASSISITPYSGTRRLSKEIKSIFQDKDASIFLDVHTADGQPFSWGEKYYGNKGTFARLKATLFQKHLSSLRQVNRKYKNIPFYFFLAEPLSFHRDDFSDGSIKSLEDVFSAKNFFLPTFTIKRFASLQNNNEKISNFHKEFLDFLSHFQFKHHRFSNIETFIDDDQSSFHLRNCKLTMGFRWVLEDASSMDFEEVDKNDLAFFLFLGEIYTRLYLIRFYNLSDCISGIIFLAKPFDSFYQIQLEQYFPNFQFFTLC